MSLKYFEQVWISLTFLAKGRIVPSAEKVFLVPFTLTMSNHHNFVFSRHFV